MESVVPNNSLTDAEVLKRIEAQSPPYKCPRCGSTDVQLVWKNGQPKVVSHITYRGLGRCKQI